MAVTKDIELHPFDLARTFFLQRFGLYDPTVEVTPKSFRKAFASKSGVCVVNVSVTRVSVSGADEEGVLADLLAALRTDDGHDTFAPSQPLIAKLHRTSPGLRIVRVPWRFDVACGTVLQQRVTVREAIQQWSRIAKKYGERADGRLVAFPSAERLSHMASWRLEELGVDPKRTRAMLVLARDVHRRSLFDSTDIAHVRKHLLALRGIGPWTAETTLGYGFGDVDAVPTADLHLPHLVTWALAREPRGTDERMIELLEPFRGQRFRALRLLQSAGISVPVTRR